jgi:hypothetical protein
MLGVVVLVGENRALILKVCIQAEVVVVVGEGSWEALELIAVQYNLSTYGYSTNATPVTFNANCCCL